VPPGFDYAKFSPEQRDEFSQIEIDFEYAPRGWRWAYDPALPTNRKANEPYNAKESRKSLIDFYLISPNLRLLMVKTIDQGFAFSDHQPVYLEVELK
jgi:endonuclease/exonuclease/phosphatase family metal-dependent hydrolase